MGSWERKDIVDTLILGYAPNYTDNEKCLTTAPRERILRHGHCTVALC